MKTRTERQELKEAKAANKKALRHRDAYKARQEKLLRTMVSAKTPRWGGLIINVQKY